MAFRSPEELGQFIVLIETLWNVNAELSSNTTFDSSVLIETLWNVNYVVEFLVIA